MGKSDVALVSGWKTGKKHGGFDPTNSSFEFHALRHIRISDKKIPIENGHGRKANERGRKAEQIVADILEKFKQEGYINGYRQSKHNDKDDRKAKDFRIYTPCEKGQLTIPLQVKSSWAQAIIHNKKYNNYRNRNEKRHHKSKSQRRLGGKKGEAVERIPCVVAYDPGCEQELRNIVARYKFNYGVI